MIFDNRESFRALMENILRSTDADEIGICLGIQAATRVEMEQKMSRKTIFFNGISTL